MESIKQMLFTNWHLMRIVRLAIGIWLLAAGIQYHDWVSGTFSLFFLYQAVTDTGCCGSKGCYAPAKRSAKQTTEDIEYEEVK